MIYLDTSALIRFFTNDDEIKAKKIKSLIESDNELSIVEVVFPELEYVLLRLYSSSRNEVSTIFTFLISCKNIKLSPEIKRAASLYENSNLDMADCLIAVHSQKGKLASFDNDLLKVKAVKSYWK